VTEYRRRACGQAFAVGAKGVVDAAVPMRVIGNGGRLCMAPLW
jgi:hypothetical protein